MEEYLKKLSQAAEYIKDKIGVNPDIAVILGSGLGSVIDDIDNAVEIKYSEIPNFPQTSVEGHAGLLVSGRLGGKNVLAMKGRFHYYEGYDISQVVFPVRVFRLLGIKGLLVTNAAGGVNKEFKPGDLMLIKDHISFFAVSPLRGRNLDQFGTRFPDMTEAYSRDLMQVARKAASSLGIDLKEGVYAFTQGPMFETPAEVRALAILGADAVGMSTVPEVITARHGGIKVLGISCITNMAAGILEQPLQHGEVMETASRVEKKFAALVRKIISDWPE